MSMLLKDNYSDSTNSEEYRRVFSQHEVPVFQNKVYPSSPQALQTEKGNVELVQSLISGFVFNNAFDPARMNYDIHYQNEQSSSLIFKKHLEDVLELLKSFGIAKGRVIEIGSGKGVFFEMMLEAGIDCVGFDPTYEGNNEKITKKYFDESYKGAAADFIIMRHTLEHIPHPFSFLHTVASANDYKGYLFVEVPTFDWIVRKNAFWDIFYEHCNYFTEESLGNMFDEAMTGNFFGGQYIYLWADLGKLRPAIPGNLVFKKYDLFTFEKRIDHYKEMLLTAGGMAVWGAGAKGSTFLNLLDKQKKNVQYVIDINPAKQNKFIAGTGHPIYEPRILKEQPVNNVLVMNENYIEEIKRSILDLGINANILSL